MLPNEITTLLLGAAQIMATFKGDAADAKSSSYVQEAVATLAAITPIVQQFGNGTEVTIEDARAALAGKDAALARLDKIIAGMA